MYMSTEHCAGFFLNTFDAILVGQLGVICGGGFMKIPLPCWGRDTPEYKRWSTEREMVLIKLFMWDGGVFLSTYFQIYLKVCL